MSKKEILTPNQILRKRRTTRYFLDAAKEIAREKGLDGITIRNVADRAGYNSATIYNYFENVEQLVALTAVDMIQPWIRSGSQVFRENEDVLDQYVGGWKVFCEHAFRDPEGFAYIYSVRPEGVAKSFRIYEDLFGKDQEDSIYSDLSAQQSLAEQEESTIRPCIEAGYIAEEDAEGIYGFALLLFDGLIWRVLRERKAEHADEYTRIFLTYFLDYLSGRLQKKRDLSRFLR